MYFCADCNDLAYKIRDDADDNNKEGYSKHLKEWKERAKKPSHLFCTWQKEFLTPFERKFTKETDTIPATSGTGKEHCYLKVCECGTYRDVNGDEVAKPQINLNVKWLEKAGFNVGDQIEVIVAENELVIRKLIP